MNFTISLHLLYCFAEVVDLKQYAYWTVPDSDYTLNTTRMSAVWPTARYPIYEWGIIEDNGAIGEVIPQHPCEHEDVVRCGVTDKEFINVYGLQLMHGQSYRVCIHANATTADREEWVFGDDMDELIECSDGIVVDKTPPIPGTVWIGETSDDALHHSGIHAYQVCAGSQKEVKIPVEMENVITSP